MPVQVCQPVHGETRHAKITRIDRNGKRVSYMASDECREFHVITDDPNADQLRLSDIGHVVFTLNGPVGYWKFQKGDAAA